MNTTNKLADIKFAPDGGFKGFGPLGLEENALTYDATFQNFISSVIGIISIIAIIWFVIIVITSGISYMSAGSDQKATEAARKKITNGLVGLLITIFGIFIIRLAGQLLNIPNILSIPALLDTIKIK